MGSRKTTFGRRPDLDALRELPLLAKLLHRLSHTVTLYTIENIGAFSCIKVWLKCANKCHAVMHHFTKFHISRTTHSYKSLRYRIQNPNTRAIRMDIAFYPFEGNSDTALPTQSKCRSDENLRCCVAKHKDESVKWICKGIYTRELS